MLFTAEKFNGNFRCFLKAVGPAYLMAIKQVFAAAQKNCNNRFGNRVRIAEDFLHDGIVSQFGNKSNDFGFFISLQPLYPLEHSYSADFREKIMPAGTDDL